MLIINNKHIAKTKELRVNRQIGLPEIMVIDETGNPLGLMKTENALNLAYEKELDLVEVSPNLNPPVWKIMDYGKYLYRISKQKRQQVAKQKRVETKSIRLSMRAEKHDLEFKARNAVKFLGQENKVKIDMILKGREKSHFDFASEKFENFLNLISSISKADKKTADREIIREQSPKKTPQGFVMIIEYKKK
jgi:translation initiation factor IF-3